MAVLTLAQLEDLFWGVTVTMTALDESAVGIAYQPESEPAWEKGEDVVFINITPQNDAYDKKRDITYLGEDSDSVEAVESVFYTRVMEVQWTFYGPNSYDLADKVRSDILGNTIRGVLRAAEVYPLTDITAPVRAPYDFMGQNWQRTDLRALFNVATLRTGDVPYLTSATVEIDTDQTDSLSQIIEIEEP